MKTKAQPYKGGRLGTISKLHHKVTHGDVPYSLAEMMDEDREIKKLADIQLVLVCPDCFPLRESITWKSERSAESYSTTFPGINRVVSAEQWEKEMDEKYGPLPEK